MAAVAERLALTTAALLAAVGAPSCSLFVPAAQRVVISTSDPHAEIRANGRPLGTGAVVASLRRDQTWTFVARAGDREARTVVESRLSATGVLDLAGGLLFYLPFVGLFAAGAFELERTEVELRIEAAAAERSP